jgi:hypothetical protein
MTTGEKVSMIVPFALFGDPEGALKHPIFASFNE